MAPQVQRALAAVFRMTHDRKDALKKNVRSV